MPEYPFVYATSAPRPVHPSGTRVRFSRRRAGAEGEEPGEGRGEGESWRGLLAEAVADLNASFRRAGAPFSCSLEEDEEGITLHLRRRGAEGPGEEVEEEVLEPEDFPRWLARIRAGLGILVDETA